jgi:hypothetical protein
MFNLIVAKKRILNTPYDSQVLFCKAKLLIKYYSSFKYQPTMHCRRIYENRLEIIHHHNIKIKFWDSKLCIINYLKYTATNSLEIQLISNTNFKYIYNGKK